MLVRRRIQTPSDAKVLSVVQPEGEVVLGASPPARLPARSPVRPAVTPRLLIIAQRLSKIGRRARIGGGVATRVGINGFGRIGRNFYRACLKRQPDFQIAAVNDLADPEVLAHVLKYDSTHGVLEAEISASEDGISVNGETFKVLSEREPAQLPWGDLGVEIVVESTGLFTDREGASKHLEAEIGRAHV